MSKIISTAQKKYLRLKSLTSNDTSTKRSLDEGVEYTKSMKADIETARSKYKAKNKKTKPTKKVAEDSKREESKKRLPKKSEKETVERKKSGKELQE